MCRLALLLTLLLLCTAGARAAPASLWQAGDSAENLQVRLHFFWTRTCPHCTRARPFVAVLADRYPWLQVASYDVTDAPAAQEAFALTAAAAGRQIEGVPSFLFCGRMLVGFDDAAHMGVLLEAALRQCRGELLAAATGETVVPAPAPPPATTVSLPGLGVLDAAAVSLPVLTVLLGGLDAFNPCAFFVLLFLLSLLVHARSRARMLLIGGVFVACSGLVYFAFMAAWLNLFLVLEGVGWVTRLAGAVAVVVAMLNIKDFFAVRRGPSLAIPEAARPGLFARMRGLVTADSLPALLAGTVALALTANAYELLCTSGLPLVYTRVLTLAELPLAHYYAYLAAYNVVYVLPLLAIVGAFTWTLGQRRLSETEGRRLKLMSGLMMLGLGLLLLVYPQGLDNLATAVVLLLGAVVVTVLIVLVERRLRPDRSAG